MSEKVRVIALYLPQYHPIPENDKWWGKGFTEWRSVASAKPLFKGHNQPRIPADLGFYDLRLPEIREQQAELAREAGIEGFCYYHYWFSGEQLLQRPFEEVLSSGKPDFPFCLCWANHTWSNKTWTKKSGNLPSVIMEQTYSNEDIDNHFNYLLSAFKDKRYITVDNKPLFVIYKPQDIPNLSKMMSRWKELAIQNGLEGIHFVGFQYKAYLKSNTGKISDIGNTKETEKLYHEALNLGLDAITSEGMILAELKSGGKFNLIKGAIKKRLGLSSLTIFDQKNINDNMYVPQDGWENVYPQIMPNWDRSPRNRNTSIYVNSTPHVFKDVVKKVIKIISSKKPEHRIIFLKSWNEWGEGNYMEPDTTYGKGYIKALREALDESSTD